MDSEESITETAAKLPQKELFLAFQSNRICQRIKHERVEKWQNGIFMGKYPTTSSMCVLLKLSTVLVG